MFDYVPAPTAITVSPVASRRDGWHPLAPIGIQDRLLLQLEPRELNSDEALSALVALQEHRAQLDALEVSLLVRAAGARQVVRDVLVDSADSVNAGARELAIVDEVVDEIACALRRPHGVVQRQVQHARLLNGPLARTRRDLGAGLITLQHACALAEQADRMANALRAVDPNSHSDADLALATACERLQDRVLFHAHHETPAQTRTRARRAVVSVDPAGERVRRQRARRGCDVTGYGIGDGLAIIEARLPVSAAGLVLSTVDARARASVSEGRTRDPEWLARHGLDASATLGQLRAAAFVDLMRSDFVEPGETGGPATCLDVEVQVLVDAATLAGLDPDGVAWARVGSGALEAFGREDLVRLLTDPTTHATMRRMVIDPTSGALVDPRAQRYRISSSLAAWIADRDQTCRFPGCSRRSDRCDVDHAVDFADGGPTAIGNTGALCRRHHNRKTHSGWTISDSQPDGSCTFTSPAGRIYRHVPVELDPRPAPPPPTPKPPPPGSVAAWRPGDPMPF